MTFPQTLVLRYAHFEPAERKQPQVADDYAEWFCAGCELEPLLSAREYLCAGRFTAADVSVGYALLLAEHLGLAKRFTLGGLLGASAGAAGLQGRDGCAMGRRQGAGRLPAHACTTSGPIVPEGQLACRRCLRVAAQMNGTPPVTGMVAPEL